MADPPAAAPAAPDGAPLGLLPPWSPSAASNALKTTIGVILAWGIVLWLQWPQPFMAPVAVVALQTPYLGASIQKGLMRIIGTLTGALLVLLLLAWLVQEQWLLISALSLAIGAGIYAMRHSSYAYAWLMLVVNMAVIAGDAAAAPGSAFELAVYRSAQTVIGILVVLAVNGLLWPRTGGRAYADKRAAVQHELAAHLRRLGAQVSDAAALESPRALRGAGVALREILAAAALDSDGFGRLRRTYEAQIQAVGDLVGSLMAFGEALRLVAEADVAVLSTGERALVSAALADLARAADTLADSSPNETAAALGAARLRCERLLASAKRLPSAAAPDNPGAGRDSALLHAAALQLRVLIDEMQTLADTSAAVAAGRLPRDGQAAGDRGAAQDPAGWTPAARRPVSLRRLGDGLPDALAAAIAYWTMMLVWIELQWPPVGFLGVLMAVLVIGLDALTALPVRQSAWAAIFGALTGILIAAPIYLLATPRLDGFGELALVLFPFYYAILYLFHALPRPRNLVVLRVAIISLIMLHLAPSQTYDAASYLSVGASVLTGFIAGVALLGVLRGMPPREQLRRRLRDLLRTLDRALADLAEPGRPGFERRVRQHAQSLRAQQQLIAETAPLVHAPHVPQNDPARIQALVDAAEALSIRFRALQRARARWVGAAVQSARSASADPLADPRAQALAKRWRDTFRGTLDELLAAIERPYPRATLKTLDASRARLRADLQALHDCYAPAAAPETALHRLGIAGHYVGVARALRETAAAINAIDWAAWRVPRF